MADCGDGVVCCGGPTATNGVVLATEKKLPTPLIDESSVQKTALLTNSIGVVYAGMGPDSRVLIVRSPHLTLWCRGSRFS